MAAADAESSCTLKSNQQVRSPSPNWIEKRTTIRKGSAVNDTIRRSLQSLDVSSVKRRIEGVLADRHTTSRIYKARYTGLMYVLDELTATDNCGKSKGLLLFDEAYELYASAYDSLLPEPDRQNFRDFLLSEDFGLPVCIFSWNSTRYIVLNPQSWNIVNLLELFCDKPKEPKRFNLDAESLSTIINSMETEYDRSVVRGIIAATATRSEIYDLAIKPDIAVKSLERIVSVSQEVENALVAGHDMVTLSLRSKIEKKEQEIESLKMKVHKLTELRADSRHIETQNEQIAVKTESLQNLRDLLECKDKYCKQRFNTAAKIKSKQLIEENRMRKRATGAGAKRKLDDIDEELIAKAIEQKTTAHGRRHDMVLYYHKRVKRDDLLNIANYYLIQQGKQMIKSATTVYNRAKPKRERSLQAKRHIGKGLFCSKKPPKTADTENILTHHQRKHVELCKLHLYSVDDNHKWAVDVSADDKAYIRPETSVGMCGTKHQSLLQPTMESGLEIRALPSHDFCDSRLYTTPSAYRFMSHEVEEINGKQRAVLKNDISVVTVRPKYYVGSGGSTWASEHVYLRWHHPELFEVEGSNYNHILRTFTSMVRDTLSYFIATTEKKDVYECVENDPQCKFRAYENCRLEHSICGLVDAQLKWKNSYHEVSPVQKAIGNEILDVLEDAVSELEALKKSVSCAKTFGIGLWEKFAKCIEVCQKIIDDMELHKLPAIARPRFLMRTDKGPGVSLTNYEVKFRDAELVLLYDLDWHMRIHQAVNDPCPAERTNACIGDAVADGGSLPFNHFDVHKDFSESELEQMSSKDIKELEDQTVEKNVWFCCQEVCDRVDEAPGPHGYMSAHVTPRPESQFFYNTKFLLEYHTTGSESAPGHNYFKKVENFMERHFTEGENFREFLKFSCKDADCPSCAEWVGPPITACPRPFPDASSLPDYHYLTYNMTPAENREIDDFQPRSQLKKAHAEKKVKSSDAESVASFADKYIVKPRLVLEYLHHLEAIEFKKEKRRLETIEEKKTAQEKPFEQYNWKELTKDENNLKKLRVTELDKYLRYHGLSQHLKLKKLQKVVAILQHWHGTENRELRIESEVTEHETDSEEEGEEEWTEDTADEEEKFEDIVLNVIQEGNINTSRSGRRVAQKSHSDYLYF